MTAPEIPTTDAAPDIAALTEAGRQVWSSGDFGVIARQTMAMAEDLCALADPHPGQRVLDLACGRGNVALVAARRYCAVAGIDIAANLIDHARARAAAEGSEIDFWVGDAQSLPWPDGHFDAVFSVFGVMFAPDQARAAAELVRVCRPGGTIALASWMTEAFGADFFGAHARHAPPPPGAPSPLRLGTEDGLAAVIGPGCARIESRRHATRAYYRSVAHAVDLFERHFGPTIRARSVVGEAGHAALARDLAAVLERYNEATDGTAIVRTEYLRTVATRA